MYLIVINKFFCNRNAREEEVREENQERELLEKVVLVNRQVQKGHPR